MTTYRVHFERLGRDHHAKPLVCTAIDADDLAAQIFNHARKSLASATFEVIVDLEKMRGSIEYGRFGEFAIVKEEG